MQFLRRLRGVLGTALTWGTSWAVAGFALGSVAVRFVPPGILPANVLFQVALRWGFLGAFSGAAFAVALSIAERRRAHSVDELSLRRVAWWGAVGGIALPLVLLPVVAVTVPAALLPALGLLPVGAVLGGVSAATSLRAARRGQRLAAPLADPTFLPPTT